MAVQTQSPGTRLVMEDRKKLTLTGATEVVRFDETLVELNTNLGPVVIEGSELKLKCLSLEDGTLVVQGQIRGFTYEDPRIRRGLFR